MATSCRRKAVFCSALSASIAFQILTSETSSIVVLEWNVSKVALASKSVGGLANMVVLKKTELTAIPTARGTNAKKPRYTALNASSQSKLRTTTSNGPRNPSSSSRAMSMSISTTSSCSMSKGIAGGCGSKLFTALSLCSSSCISSIKRSISSLKTPAGSRMGSSSKSLLSSSSRPMCGGSGNSRPGSRWCTTSSPIMRPLQSASRCRAPAARSTASWTTLSSSSSFRKLSSSSSSSLFSSGSIQLSSESSSSESSPGGPARDAGASTGWRWFTTPSQPCSRAALTCGGAMRTLLLLIFCSKTCCCA